MQKIIASKIPSPKIVGSILGMMMLTACLGSGNTDGGKNSDAVNASGDMRYAADGGAGATISLETPETISVGETDDFKVVLKDPLGAPLDYIRIFCESEKGIAILEPSSGGVAFEHTSANGIMSGVIGGLLPGSYIMECRAPEGYGLIARQSIRVVGSVPAGFVGFPGAAGGNLGGGVLVEQDPDEIDGSSGLGLFRITSASVSDGGSKMTSGPIDIVFGTCTDGAATPKITPEPVYFNSFYINVQNDSTEKATIGTVGFTIEDGGPSMTSTQSKVVVVNAGSTAEVDGILTEFIGGEKVFAGSTYVVKAGTYKVNIVLTGELDKSGSFTLTRSMTLTFAGVNRCPEGTYPAS